MVNRYSYTIARLVDEKNEEFLCDENGDDCFTDDLEMAITFESIDLLPELKIGEYIVRIVIDDEGWVEQIIRKIK